MAVSLFSLQCCWSWRLSEVAQGFCPATEEVADHQDGSLDADVADIELRTELRHFHDVGTECAGGPSELDHLAAFEPEAFRSRRARHATRVDRVRVPGEVHAVGSVPGTREDFLRAFDNAATCDLVHRDQANLVVDEEVVPVLRIEAVPRSHMHQVPGAAVRKVERARGAGAIGKGVAGPIWRRIEMAIDVEVADAAVLVKIGERAGAWYRHRVIASTKNDLGPAVQALRQIFIDVLMRLGIVPRNDRHVSAIDDVEECQQIDVVLEHIGKILRRGFAYAGCTLRGAGADDLALVPWHADEAHLGYQLSRLVAIRRALRGPEEGRDSLRLEGPVVQLRRINVIVGAFVLIGAAMLMRHMLPDVLSVVAHVM